LGVDVSAVYRLIERNELPHVRLIPRGAIRIPRSALDVKQQP
jgi:excisionase family DNA binding protein